MKKAILIFLVLTASYLFAQNNWQEVWNLQQVPFQDQNSSSEYAKVIAGFDTDEDGWGEFITGYTDLDSNYVFMYEASGDNTYEMVWYFKFPKKANSYFAAAVGDVDDNGVVDIVIGYPVAVTADDPNPVRVFTFKWNGVQGENNYGVKQADGSSTATSGTFFDLPEMTDWRPYSMIIDDIDKDGDNELVIGVRAGGRGREVMVASVTGELGFFGSWVIEYNFMNSEGGSNYATTVGDLDNDGMTDIFEMVWNKFTLRMFEVTGPNTVEHVNDIEQLYGPQNIDYGAVDGVKIVDANGDGKNEMFICGTESNLALFLIQNITDISTITGDDVVEFYNPQTKIKPNGKIVEDAGMRNMDVGDPDNDGKIDLMICAEKNGQILDLEYKGTGDLADPANWELTIAYDIFDKAAAELGDSLASLLTPRLYYGAIAGDMDGDGKTEYVFTNYSTDKSVWANDLYISVLETDQATGVNSEIVNIPKSIELSQNYPNPFNPTTTIKYAISKSLLETQNIASVRLVVYDILGREIAALVNERQAPGNYSVKFDASNLSAGIYLYKLSANGFVRIRKMILMK